MSQRGRLASPLLLAAAVLLTAGCAPTVPEPAPTASPTSGPAPTATAQPTPEPTPAAEQGRPLDLGCEDLVSLQEMYDINPNIALLGELDPEAGSLAAIAVAEHGVACRWVHTSSNETIDIAIADLPDSLLEQRRAAAGESTDAYGTEGYFERGAAQAISGSYWISAVSPMFVEAGDAIAVIGAARP